MPLARSSLLSFSSAFTAADAKSVNPSVFFFFAVSNACLHAAEHALYDTAVVRDNGGGTRCRSGGVGPGVGGRVGGWGQG